MFARYSRLAPSIALALLLSNFSAPARAQITVGGDAGGSPSNPATWTSSTSAKIGINSGKTGTVTAAGGSSLLSSYAYLGYNAGSNGSAVVTGQGSSWTNSGTLWVGYNGAGTLTVENGGTVTTGTLYASASDLRGDGTINTSGLVADVDLVFDATHDVNQALSFGTGGTLNLSLISANPLGVGCGGAGSLRIADGVKISSSYGYLGYKAGSSGSAVVTGQGSSWTNSDDLWVGRAGTGTLTVENGATVTAKTLCASASDLRGDGTINTQGLITDTDLVFDAAHGANQVLSFGTGGTLNLSLSNVAGLGAGYGSAGSLRIADGVKISSYYGCLGYNAGSSGSAVVTGQGSSWTNSYDNSLYVGYQGSGTLTVDNGGMVSSSIKAYLGFLAGSSGSAVVTGPGSSWTTGGELYVGNSGTGTLSVENGGKVSSFDASLGYGAGSSGSAVVTGAGTQWTNSSTLYVGNTGTGTLKVENGGMVSSSTAYLGAGAGSSGSVVVTGQGSSWTNSGTLYMGGSGSGSGALTVGNGGKVKARVLNIHDISSKTNVHVSGNDMIVLGTAAYAGTMVNNGKVNLYADAFLATGTYSPITAYPGKTITWSGSGTYNGYGGTWDSTAHTFTVASAAASAAGASNTLTTGERLLITDSASGKRIGASFGTLAAGTTFRADWIGGGSFAGIPDTQGIRGAWSFTTNFAGDQALLSYELGAGVGAGPSDLQVWRYNGTAWTSFAAPDLTYGDDGIANFAVTSFTRYAITIAKHPGDANDDGAVNVVDLGVLAKNYDTAAGATWAMADFSGDGAVNVVDLGVLAKNYDWVGTPAGAIPEPCSVALLALGGLTLLRRRAAWQRGRTS